MSALACLITLCLAGITSESTQHAPSNSFAERVQPLLDEHCVGCHGPEVRKAGLRLDNVRFDLADETILARFVKVHDQLVSGAMPPRNSDRPDAKALADATVWLSRQLHDASLARQRKQGRVVLRRLNATEYENTVRDLVGTNVSLKEMLPEENSGGGFDNIAALLDVSGTHQLIYQEAAERAVNSVIPTQPPVPCQNRQTGREISKKGPNFQQTINRSCRLDGEALLFYTKLPRYGLCATPTVPMAGRYRVLMSIAALGAENRAVPAALLTVEQSGNEDPVVREFRDIAPGKPSVVEVEIDLKRRQAFVVNMLANWDWRTFKKSLEEYPGPGLRVDWIEIEGPIGPFPPASYDRLFSGVPLKPRSVDQAEREGKKPPRIAANRGEYAWSHDPLVPSSAQPKADAERLIRAFLPKALRRPVEPDLERRFIKPVLERIDKGDAFVDAMMYGYKSILSSPHFLLFNESRSVAKPNADASVANGRLDGFALASRLSYFLWSSSPDDTLLALAAKGELDRPEVLWAQVERLLNDPRAYRFTEDFTGQWLDLRKIDATIPDPHLYHEFDGTLLWSMPRETRSFFEEVLRNDRSLLDFVDSDWTMLNERLARHYGISGVYGNQFRKVQLPQGSHRGGVMTHASILKVTADGTYTSPILRGKWVLDRIIGKPPAPPPADVPPLEPDIRGATTIREQLDKHRNIPVCASCHSQIDPPGFALEAYDPIGGYREYYRASARTKAGIDKALSLPSSRPIYRGPDVEQAGETADGRKFKNLEEYKQILLSDKNQLARNLVRKMLTYATGAEIEFADREVVEQIVASLRARNYGFRTLIHEVVQSRIFLNK